MKPEVWLETEDHAQGTQPQGVSFTPANKLHRIRTLSCFGHTVYCNTHRADSAPPPPPLGPTSVIIGSRAGSQEGNNHVYSFFLHHPLLAYRWCGFRCSLVLYVFMHVFACH